MKPVAFFRTGALLAGLAVVAGAFGAHSLQEIVSASRLDTFETAVTYQMYHALGLLIVGWMGRTYPSQRLQWAGYCFLGGIALFSGSLYLLVLTDTGWLGAITPFGGVAFIAGWALLSATSVDVSAGSA